MIAIDAAVYGPWGSDVSVLDEDLARWFDGRPRGRTVALRNVPGFAFSPFVNLAYEVNARCLRGAPVNAGIVMASILGDTYTADQASKSVAQGRTPAPLLFYQSVPSAVLGQVTREHPVDGPIVCLSGGPNLYRAAMEIAEMILGEPEVDAVVVSYVEAGESAWRAQASVSLEAFWGVSVVPDCDCAVGVLLGTDHVVQEDCRSLEEQFPRPLSDFLRLARSAQSVQPTARGMH